MNVSRWILSAMLAACMAGASLGPSYAQAAKSGSEMTSLFDEVNDIDKLRIINPIKLTPDQLDKLIAMLQQEQKDYNRRLDAAATEPLKNMSTLIHDTRQKLLSGGDVPQDFDAKIKQMQDDFIKKRKEEDDNTLTSVTNGVRKILSPAQIEQIVSMARDAMPASARKAGTKPDDTAVLKFYVVNTFIAYPRIVPLLRDMRKAAGGTQTGSAANRLQEAKR